MRSRQDKSLTQETYELFTSHIIKLIQTESKCSPYIAKVKVERNKYVPCVTFHATSEKITVELGLCEGIKELPPAIVEYIRKNAQSIFDQFNIKCSVEIIGKSLTKAYNVSQQDLVRLVLNLAPFSGLTFAEFNKNTKDKDIRDKVAFLGPYLRNAIFTNDFISAAPNFKKYNHPLESTALYDLLINIFENLKEIQNKSEVLMDSLIYQFKKYSSVEIQFNTSGDKNVYIMFERAIDMIARSIDDPVKKWSTYLTLKNFLEDYEGNRILLANHATTELKKAKILVQSVENLIAVFDKIPESEYLKILGSTTIFTSLPTHKQRTDLVHVCELLHEANVSNLNQLDSAIKLFEIVLKMANPFLPEHEKPENTNTSEVQLVKNKAPATLHKQEVISAALTQELLASSKPMALPEEIASSTPDKHEVNPQSFFANGSQSPTKSLTSIIKQEAKEKIAKQKIKTTKPATGKHIESQNSTAESVSYESTEKTVYFHSENNTDEPIAAKAFLLPGMKHIYFCCDASHMQGEKEAVIKEFQQIAQQGIILARNSQGQEGIKMYGLNFAYLKSLSKTISANRMLCIAHPIEGTNLHVYRFEKCLSHVECEKLIADKSGILERLADNSREHVTASFSSEALSLGYRAALK